MMIRQRNKLSKFKYEQINNQISKYSIDMSEKWKPKGKYLPSQFQAHACKCYWQLMM